MSNLNLTEKLHQQQQLVPVTCLYCGTSNPIMARICARCGSALIIPDGDYNLQMRIGARTDVGKVRSHNEDDMRLWALDGVVMALVADGMGGAAAGEEASRLAVQTVQADFLDIARDARRLPYIPEEELKKRLLQALSDANTAVIDKARANPAFKGMGTTSTLALVRGNRLLISHVGDSRLYYIDGKRREIMQVTSDHSFVSALLASGHITAEQAKNHPMTNVLFRAIGQGAALEVDLYEKFLRAGDCLVVCSDGLTKHVETDEAKMVVLQAHDPQQVADDLINLANDRGGEDNISVIVIMFEDAEPDSDDMTDITDMDGVTDIDDIDGADDTNDANDRDDHLLITI